MSSTHHIKQGLNLFPIIGKDGGIPKAYRNTRVEHWKDCQAPCHCDDDSNTQDPCECLYVTEPCDCSVCTYGKFGPLAIGSPGKPIGVGDIVKVLDFLDDQGYSRHYVMNLSYDPDTNTVQIDWEA